MWKFDMQKYGRRVLYPKNTPTGAPTCKITTDRHKMHEILCWRPTITSGRMITWILANSFSAANLQYFFSCSAHLLLVLETGGSSCSFTVFTKHSTYKIKFEFQFGIRRSKNVYRLVINCFLRLKGSKGFDNPPRTRTLRSRIRNEFSTLQPWYY